MLNGKKYTVSLILFICYSQIQKKCGREKRERKENNSENIEVRLAIFDMIMKLENKDFIYLFPV